MTTICVPINLPNTEVINITSRDNGDMIVRIKSTETGTHCKCCGKTITKQHSLNKTILLNHLPTFGNPVYIELQPIRYQCLDCKWPMWPHKKIFLIKE
jgi:transposase